MIPKYMVWVGQAALARKGMTSQFAFLLGRMGEDVRLYGEAFSPMAKRNLATALAEKVAEFERDWRKAYGIVPVPDLVRTLGAAARAESGVGAGLRRYEHVTCVAIRQKTGKFDSKSFVAHWNGKDYEYGNIVAYDGSSDDKADAAARSATLRSSIREARQLHASLHGSYANDAKTLKICMAPEFYFRGMRGAYDISRVADILAELRTETDKPIYADWLFVFGTVIGASFDERMTCMTCGKSGKDAIERTGNKTFACRNKACGPGTVRNCRWGATIDNVALVQKGGETGDANTYVVAKEYVSHIDFQRQVKPEHRAAGKAKTGYDSTAILPSWSTNRMVNVLGTTTSALAPSGSRDYGGSPSRHADERMGGSIFTIDGVRFGLEICLDHLNRRLRPGSGVQVQLVPSAGASLQQFACVPNGIAFNVDGGEGTSDVRVNDGSGPANAKAPGFVDDGDIRLYDPVALPA